MNYILVILLSYLTGAIPFAYITVKLVGKKDIREYGSGNVGATNAMRILGWKWAIAVFLLDIFKGIFSVLYISKLGPQNSFIKIIAAFCVIIGNVYSIFLKFDGGKGAATSLGVVISLTPVGAFAGIGVWLLTLLTTKISSIATLITAIFVSVFNFIYYDTIYINIFIIVMVLFLVFTHRSNIKRLVKGKENKL